MLQFLSQQLSVRVTNVRLAAELPSKNISLAHSKYVSIIINTTANTNDIIYSATYVRSATYLHPKSSNSSFSLFPNRSPTMVTKSQIGTQIQINVYMSDLCQVKIFHQ